MTAYPYRGGGSLSEYLSQISPREQARNKRLSVKTRESRLQTFQGLSGYESNPLYFSRFSHEILSFSLDMRFEIDTEDRALG